MVGVRYFAGIEKLAHPAQWAAAPPSARRRDILGDPAFFRVRTARGRSQPVDHPQVFTGTSRFEDFTARIGASAPAVSRALKQLEAAHIITRVPYRESGSRARDEYRLTPAGEDLLLSLTRQRCQSESLSPGAAMTV